MSPFSGCQSNIDWSSIIRENATCNENVDLILLAVCFALEFGSCLPKDKKELFGNLMMVAGQILITTGI